MASFFIDVRITSLDQFEMRRSTPNTAPMMAAFFIFLIACFVNLSDPMQPLTDEEEQTCHRNGQPKSGMRLRIYAAALSEATFIAIEQTDAGASKHRCTRRGWNGGKNIQSTIQEKQLIKGNG